MSVGCASVWSRSSRLGGRDPVRSPWSMRRAPLPALSTSGSSGRCARAVSCSSSSRGCSGAMPYRWCTRPRRWPPPAPSRPTCADCQVRLRFRPMAVSFLDFEQPIAELEAKIEELRHVTSESEVNIQDEIARLQAKSRQLTMSIFASLTPWQITQLARHPHRPYTLDYVNAICSEFNELHGDRMYADDGAIVGGLARIDERALMIIGHQKGRDTKERVRRNYGMPKPEGYRKALRLMRLAERFGLPLLTLIDTQGAYPGVGAEERGQSEAIARNLFEMSVLRIPIITVVTGEGGSGGALGIGVCDRLLMLQYSTYSVISPEGCASILWKSQDKKEAAADALNLTADRLQKLGLVDELIEEPLGGAHRDPAAMAVSLKAAVIRHLDELETVPRDQLRAARAEKIAGFGVFAENAA